MPAVKLNYVVTYKNDAQVYGTASKDIALSSPPPEGMTLKDKEVFFISREPDTGKVAWYKVADTEVQTAEIVHKKKKKKEAVK